MPNNVLCKKCQSENDSNQRFCNQCGTSLIQYCRSCHTENKLNAVYCGQCGKNLAEAKISLTDKEMDDWYNHFNNFWGYCAHHTEEGFYRKTVRPIIMQYNDSFNPPLFGKTGDNVTLKIPLAKKDWCIRNISFGGSNFTSGGFYTFRNRLMVVDPQQRMYKVIEYQNLKTVIQSGQTITIQSTQGETMVIEFQIPKVDNSGLTAARAGQALNFIGGLINDMSDKNYTDKKLDELQYEHNMQRASDDIQAFKNQKARQVWEINHFVEDITRQLLYTIALKEKFSGS